MAGAVKYCRYGACRSDSRPGRPGFDPGTKFFRFPKPCLEFRKCGLSNYRGRATVSTDLPQNFIKTHIKKCKECTICHEWIVKCKRNDNKFKSIADITKDSYICSKHFDPDISEINYRIHLPGVPAPKRRTGRGPAMIRSTILQDPENQDVPTLMPEEAASTETSLGASLRPLMETCGLSDIPDSSEVKEVDGPLVSGSDLIMDGVIADSWEPFLLVNNRGVITRTEECQTSFVNPSMETQTSFPCVSIGIQTEVTNFDAVLDENQSLKDEKQRLKLEVDLLKKESSFLRNKFKKQRRVDDFENSVRNRDDVSIFYLGFTYAKLIMILEFLDIQSISHYWNTNYQAGDKKMFTPIQEFMLTLLKLRGGLLVQDIAYRFDVSLGYVSQTCTTWIQALYCKFNALRPHMFPSREKIQEHLPERFSSMKNIRVIIDGAEIFAETPQNFEQQSNMYSHYKAHSTFKILLGCTPNGVISFVSDVFEGSISDRELVKQSKLLDLLDEGDLLLADRGFTIKDLTDSKNIELNIPAFLKGRDKLTPQEEVATKNIAKLRIFVENMVRRLKEFRLFKRVVPLSMRNTLSQCVFICACLVNFNPPLINDDKDVQERQNFV